MWGVWDVLAVPQSELTACRGGRLEPGLGALLRVVLCQASVCSPTAYAGVE